MEWQPQNLAETCSNAITPEDPITTCQASTFMFLQLVTSLLGRPANAVKTRLNNGALLEQPQRVILETNILNTFRKDEHQGLDTYDFIIIGAGTAGCVLANRLSEVANWNVLLLEAGIEEPEVADVPGLAPTVRRSNIDWQFTTQPQETNCRARRNAQCIWPRGRVMGGSSVINYMIYLRGGPRDYDEWAELGNPTWSYKEVFPYFLKSEDNQNIFSTRRPTLRTVSPKYHSTKGEWTVDYFPYQDANTFYLLEAFREIGLDIFDQNMERQVGASLLQHTNRNGRRLSTNMAFIQPIRNKRGNLRVVSQAYVTRVLINPETNTAYGVEYYLNEQRFQVFANKEVILSAGVMNSPKLLMLSGIGPADYLQSMHIPVYHDLIGVGKNLHDHTTIDGINIALSNLTATTASTQQQQSDMSQYLYNNQGPMSSTGPLQVNAFIQTSYERGYDRPDIQYSLDAADISNFYKDPILNDEANVLPIPYYNGITIRPVLLAPKSRGYILLNDTDPVFGNPYIYANTFTEEEDILRTLEGIRVALQMASTKIMRTIGAGVVTNELPACAQYAWGTDDYFICLMMEYTTTLYHPVGTCKMGRDPLAVVNHELKVYGVKNLRVIDGSIMPIVPRANTNTATLLIGEKGADFIKADWLKSYPKVTKFNKLQGFLSTIYTLSCKFKKGC